MTHYSISRPLETTFIGLQVFSRVSLASRLDTSRATEQPGRNTQPGQAIALYFCNSAARGAGGRLPVL